MVFAWILVLVAAVVVARKNRSAATGHGWRWSLVWILAGFTWSISLATGFSVGMVLLPLAAAVLLWAAWRSPHLLEATGFIGGIAMTLAALAAL